MNTPHIKAWKTKTGKINYRMVGVNGETLYFVGQGFSRKQDFKKNLTAVLNTFGYYWTLRQKAEVKIHWYKTPQSHKEQFIETWYI